ncbi:MAG: hypothetical protein ABW143_09015 [Acidimicrobiales bacterium]
MRAPRYFPDAEDWTVAYLLAYFAGTEGGEAITVDSSMPTDRPNLMVLVRRDGGTATALRDNARLTLRCWGRTESEAMNLGRETYAAVHNAGGDAVADVDDVAGLVRVPDESGQPSVMFTVQIRTRATTAL